MGNFLRFAALFNAFVLMPVFGFVAYVEGAYGWATIFTIIGIGNFFIYVSED